MILLKHELKQNYKSLLIWSLILGILTVIFMGMYESLQGDIEDMAQMYGNMGRFSQAFGMDKISFTTAMGFYGIEAGAMISICGAMFGAMTGIGILSKEEHQHTAEFLFSHPISRVRVTLEKLLFTVLQVILFNLIYFGFAVLSFVVIGEEIEWKVFGIFHLAQMLMHLQIAVLCFGISSYMRKQNVGTGLGFATLMYFLGLLYNVSDKVEGLKYITPFVYADAGTVMSQKSIDGSLAAIGWALAFVIVLLGIVHYNRKDLAS